jgi:arsenite methyltransferase
MFARFFMNMLNREAASPEGQAQRIIQSLQIQAGQAIADIGSGGGYFSLQFARRVGESGRVYAVDTESRFLDFIKRQAEEQGLDNVAFVLAAEDEVELPEAGLDLIFTRDAFHHLPEPAAYFRNLKRFLKPGGRVAIIDYRPRRGLSFANLFGHYTPEETILQALGEAGYAVVESFDFLPRQSFNVFRPG